ncbi:MAG: TonB-dependent receptor plug domain-containing protein [Deltaproteobacteria bacterium]|nr:TonB-dependent receptor plug domain-containing protein [Deltaproteobacteria bacterium]
MSTASTVAELLQTVPGLDMMQLTASNPEVSIRGFNQRLSNKVLVLVDGRTVYMDFIGSTLWSALPLTLEDIERIEIIRGPGSAIYGANAFGGVINIITRAPGDVSQQNQVSVAGGSAGLARGSVNLAGRDDRLAWKTTAGVQQLGRWSQDADPSRVDVGSPYGDHPYSVQSATASAMLQWQLSEKGFVSVSGGVNDGLSEFYSLGALRLFGIDSTSTNARVDLGLGPLYVRSFYNRFGATAQSWYAPTSGEVLGGDILSQAWDTEAQFNESFGANNQHVLTAGVGFRLKTIDWVFLTPGVKVEPHVNGYIQQQSTFGPVTLNGAIRIDRHPLENVGTRPTARLSMVTRVGEGRVIRLNGGNAFRNPTFLESYTDLYLSTGVDGVLVNSMGSEVVRERTDANYRLEPEKIRSIELGFLDQSNDSFRFEVAAYGYQVLDLIDLGSVSAEDNQLEFDATKGAYIAGESRFENETPVFWAGGGEVEGAWFGVPGLDVRLNYSFERIVSVAEDGSSTPSNAHPTHKGHAVVAWRSPWDLDVSMTVSAYSAQSWPIRSYDAAGQVAVDLVDVDAYTIVSNKLVWHPFGYDDLDLSASAWNWLALLQGAHTEYPLGQPVGARLYGGVAYRF